MRLPADFWASFDLAQRSILTGGILVIPADRGFLRLVIALLISQGMLMLTLIARPYRRGSSNALAAGQTFLLVLTYACGTCIKAFEDMAAATSPELASRVLGFESVEGFTVLLVVFAFSLPLIMLGIATATLRERQSVQVLRLKGGGARPALTLAPRLRWMLFISHVSCAGAAS